jgi:hypothetical protein
MLKITFSAHPSFYIFLPHHYALTPIIAFFLARVMQYKDQPNLEILHILLQSLLRVTIMKLTTSTPLKIDT